MNKNLFLKLGKQKELKLFLLPIFFFLVVLTGTFLVSAVPPFQQDSADTGLEIAGIDFSSIKMNMARTAVACVFNDTNGIPITSGISCSFRVYEVANSGSLKFTNNTPTINGNCYNFGIPATVYTQEGEYTRIIMCNNSNQGGYYKSTFYATPSGIDYEVKNITKSDITKFLWFLFAIALVFIILGIWKEDYNITMLGNIMLFAFGLYTLINGLAGVKDTYTYIFGISLVGVAIIITAKVMEGWLDNLNNL